MIGRGHDTTDTTASCGAAVSYCGGPRSGKWHRDALFWLLLIVVLLLIVSALLWPRIQPSQRLTNFTIEQRGQWLELDYPDARGIWVQPAQVYSIAVYPPGGGADRSPHTSVFMRVGTGEFRIDCPSMERAEELIQAVLEFKPS